MGLISNMVGTVGDFVNAVSGNKAAQDFSSEEAEKQRLWEENMSNSAYKRAVEDMKKAGINPAAMYGGSAQMASTPGGASASSSGTGFNIGTTIGQLIHSGATIAHAINEKHELKNKSTVREANLLLKQTNSAIKNKLMKETLKNKKQNNNNFETRKYSKTQLRKNWDNDLNIEL